MAEILEAVRDGLGQPRPLTAHEFEQLRELARREFGLDLKEGKQALVAARLGKKLRELGFRTFREYHAHVVGDASGEALIGLIDALTTNYTSFLREPEHFDFLRRTIFTSGACGQIRIWSAACATGEEPYSIAVAALEEGAAERVWILATDISRRALETAQRGVYPAERFEKFPPGRLKRFLLKGEGRWEGWYRFKPEVRALVEFRRLNLMEPFTQLPRFHTIFCRNVMMYFDKATQQDLVRRLTERLEPEGYLLTGHSESLLGRHAGLEYVRPAVYRRVGDGARERGR